MFCFQLFNMCMQLRQVKENLNLTEIFLKNK